MILRAFFLEILEIGFSGVSTGALRENMINIIHMENKNIDLINKDVNKQYFAISAITIKIENETIRHL
jgi:hypothetical protein